MDIDTNKEDPFDKYLQSVAYVIRGAYHQTHGHSPTQMVSGRDMFLPIDSRINWEAISRIKQEHICKSANKKIQNKLTVSITQKI